MALFESYERRIDKINGVLAQYGRLELIFVTLFQKRLFSVQAVYRLERMIFNILI